MPAGVVPAGALPAGRTTVVRAGVCVVGTGAGGAVAAARLAEAGFDVVLLEEGGYWTAADFDEDEARMTARLYADGGARATDDLAFSLLQGRAVGGGTTVNWMLMLRPADAVLDEWARGHGAERFAPAAFAAALDRVEADVHARLVPDDAHDAQNRILLDGARALGWRVRPAAIDARGCVRAGLCGLGCRYGAKQSTLVTYVPRALAAGARLHCDARVERVETRTGPGGLKRVHATLLEREGGAPRGGLVVECDVVVLAAGAVGTPAILQRSGLGGGGVGEWLRLHPTTAVGGRYGRDVYGAAGIPQSAVMTEFHDGRDGYGFWVECPPYLPGLASVALPGFGHAHRRRMTEFPRTAALIALVRDGADRARPNGSVRVDRRGRVRIRYRLGKRERTLLRDALRACARIHLAAGAEEVWPLHGDAAPIRAAADLAALDALPIAPNRLSLFSAHVNGTCRVGTDPRTSGCTPDGERHGAPGVYVADGSLLPTAPGVNPQATIMAAGAVVADAIVERHRPG